ncbi:MAG: hypothetical protein AAF639_31915 [Chloroflexota bacterium]
MTQSRYTGKQTEAWLGWLADNLADHDQAVFALDTLPPSWLRSQSQRWSYIAATWLLWLFGIALPAAMVANLFAGLEGAVVAGAIASILGGPIWVRRSFRYQPPILPQEVEEADDSTATKQSPMQTCLALGCLITVFGGIFLAISFVTWQDKHD